MASHTESDDDLNEYMQQWEQQRGALGRRGHFVFRLEPFRQRNARRYGIRRSSYHVRVENPPEEFPEGHGNIVRAFEEGLADAIEELTDNIASLQTVNRQIDDLQDTIQHWQIKYHQLYHQYFQLQQQLWCKSCRSTFEIEQDIELCASCSDRLQKLDNLQSPSSSSCPQVTTTSTVEEPSALMNTHWKPILH